MAIEREGYVEFVGEGETDCAEYMCSLTATKVEFWAMILSLY